MVLIRFYGVLATTASIFVGILTAYLVTRLSDLKSERERLRRQIESIDAELGVLISRRDFRIDRLEETENRWERESAEEDVDEFIEYTVGRDWNPNPDDVSVGDAIEAMVEHVDVAEEDLIQHHLDMIEERWDEIMDDLQPRSDLFNMGEVDVTSESHTAANWIIEALWEIYDREKYDSHSSEVMNIKRRTDELESERDVLKEQFVALDPKQLRDGVKATIVPIGLSVVLPLFVRFLHELEWVLTVPSKLVVVEPIIVFTAWVIGFFWTLYFVWNRITDGDEDLPESPLSQEDSSE